MVEIEVIYAPADEAPIHLHLTLGSGATVADALHQSGLYERYPETINQHVGIFSKQVSLDTILKTGDRVEIYRPLLIDPKEKRRQRANQSD